MISHIQRLRLWLRKYPMTRKIIKFGIVGGTSALVNLFVFWLIVMQFPAYNLISKAIGYLMGFFVGFTLNKFWTYVDQNDDGERYLLKYIMVYATTLVVYLAFNFLCDHFLYPNLFFARLLASSGQPDAAIWCEENGPFVSNVLSIILNAALNFLATNYLVFKVPDPEHLFE